MGDAQLMNARMLHRRRRARAAFPPVWTCAALLVLVGCAAKAMRVGPAPANRDAPVISVAEVIDNPDAYVGRAIRLRGVVTILDQVKGAWLLLGAAEQSDQPALFVKLVCPIDGRMIPMEAVGREAAVDGELRRYTLDEATARSLAHDAGLDEAAVEVIRGPQQHDTIAAQSLVIEGL